MFDGQSEVGPIRSLLLKHPRDAFVSQAQIDAHWSELNYLEGPDFQQSIHQYDQFLKLLHPYVPEFHFLPRHQNTGLDSLYVRDALVVTRAGVVLCRMGKKARRGEPEALQETLIDLGVPILGRIVAPARLEGGDLIWLNRGRTLVVGEGYRTNSPGIAQLRELIGDLVDEFMTVPLPHWSGPADVMHLMSLISPVDEDLAVVYSRLLPVPFRLWLLEQGIQLVEVPEAEFETLGCNVLALAPRHCVLTSGNPVTQSRLEDAGARVVEYQGSEISLKGGGGPTCLTRPLRSETTSQ